MPDSSHADLETDPRFPSGPWTGFFLQPANRRHLMELQLTFSKGDVRGEGRDWVGKFLIHGRYSLEDGKCHWTKRYLARHDVFYQGFNEGKGIWGVWEIAASDGARASRGGFHIWPEGMGDPTQPHLAEAAQPPSEAEPLKQKTETAKPELVPVGDSHFRLSIGDSRLEVGGSIGHRQPRIGSILVRNRT